MNTTIYTAVKYDWDGVANEFVVKEQVGYEYHGPILYAKKALKKLSKSFLGKIVMAVAAYYAGPLLGEAVFGGSSVLGTAASGAIAGGITGGAKGALLGGIAGGIGGYAQSGGFSDLLNSGSGSIGTAGLTPEAAGGSAFVGPDISLASPAVQAAQSAAPAAVVTGGEFVGPPADLANDFVGPPGALANNGNGFVDTGVTGQGGQSLDDGATSQDSRGVSVGLQGPTPSGYTLDQTSQLYGPMPDGSTLSENMSSGTTAPRGAGPFGDVNWKGMGLELGKAALGSALNPKPDMGAYNDYLDSMTQSNKDVTAFNKDMAGKKAAIGDQLTTDAIAMNPDYYAEQRRRGQAFADADSWANQKAGLELRGTNAQGIQAEQNRNDLFSSLRQGTAYDQGWQTGMASRNATFGTAGSMYGQLGYPTDNVGAGYGNQYNQWSQNNNATGKLIEKVTDAGQSKNTGTQKTRDNVYDMGVTG